MSLPVTEERLRRIQDASGGRLGSLEAARLCGMLDSVTQDDAHAVIVAAYAEGVVRACERCAGSRVIEAHAGDGSAYEEPCPECVGKIE